jgi:hypothetical protein
MVAPSTIAPNPQWTRSPLFAMAANCHILRVGLSATIGIHEKPAANTTNPAMRSFSANVNTASP